jgi:hypothetical protein
MAPMTAQDWQPQLAPQGRASDPDQVVEETLGHFRRLGAESAWMPAARGWFARALGIDPSSGGLVALLPAVDGGPGELARGAEALPALAKAVLEVFTVNQLGPNPRTWVEEQLRSAHGLDPDMSSSYVGGHVWRAPDGTIAYRPFARDPNTGAPAAIQYGGDELIPVAVAELAAVIEQDTAAANPGA